MLLASFDDLAAASVTPLLDGEVGVLDVVAGGDAAAVLFATDPEPDRHLWRAFGAFRVDASGAVTPIQQRWGASCGSGARRGRGRGALCEGGDVVALSRGPLVGAGELALDHVAHPRA